MFSAKEMPSPSSLFSAYASMSASVMLLRSMANELIPSPLRNYLMSTLRHFLKPKSPHLTLVIEDSSGMAKNLVFDAAELYLSTKISPDTDRLRICKTPKGRNLTVRLCPGQTVVDNFDGVELKWRYVCTDGRKKEDQDDPFAQQQAQRCFELSFHKKHKEMVLESYVPLVLERAELMQDEERVLKMFTLNAYKGSMWDSVNLEHPATFQTLAMETELKTALIQDLDRFVGRKEFYKRVGRAWKRGYLLYGPPGTGKSSLVAAMANYLKFDVYDLQLGNIRRDSDLRRLLLATGNRSILVIEDIDCSVDLPNRRAVDHGLKEEPDRQVQVQQLTLSGLLNFIDGLWSSCGDQRIIIFTTNHKERLDPALLRPGRMDMHIHMSYCTPPGFRTLASNYLGIHGHHRLFVEIEGLLSDAKVTPAQVAEEMMKSEDADVGLDELVKLLKRKKLEGDEAAEDGNALMLGAPETKRQKFQNGDCHKETLEEENLLN